MPFILKQALKLLSLNLAGEDESSKLEVRLKQAIHAKILQNLHDNSLRNVLLEFYIEANNDDADLRQMVEKSTIPGTEEALVNKS